MSTTPSKRRSRAEWEQLMASYEAGGETQREFCDQHTENTDSLSELFLV